MIDNEHSVLVPFQQRESRTPAGLMILGMHRSGTSALAGSLGICGAWLGDGEELTKANSENPKGFWERRDVRGVCDALLHSAGADWWKVASFETGAIPHIALNEQRAVFEAVVAKLNRHAVWAIKEPRLCLLFSLLRSSITNPVCIHIYRNPLEVAQSLRRRDGFGVSEGAALWEAYNRSAFDASAGLPRVVVSFEALVEHPVSTLKSLVQQLDGLGVQGLAVPEHEISNFITSKLHRERAELGLVDDFLLPSQRGLWAALQNRTILHAHPQNTASPVAQQHLRDLESRKFAIEHLTERMNAAVARAKEAESIAAARKAQVEALKSELTSHKGQSTALATDLQAQKAENEALQAELRERSWREERLSSALTEYRDRAAALEARILATEASKEQLARESKQLTEEVARQAQRAASSEEDAERCQRLNAQLDAVYASRSWRITAPIRGASRLARRALVASRAQRSLHEVQAIRIAKSAASYYQNYMPRAIKRVVPAKVRAAAKRRLGLTDSKAQLQKAAGARQGETKVGLPAGGQRSKPLGLEHVLNEDVLRTRFGQIFRGIAAQSFSPHLAEAFMQSEALLARSVVRLEAEGHRPLVSVIMPTHNRADIVGDAIRSVLEQSYSEWELFVVDDGSTDSTEDVVLGLNDPRVNYRKLPRRGAAAARNAGLDEARGEIFAYLDSDNVWHPGYLKAVVSALVCSPGRSAAYTDFLDYHVDRSGRVTIRSFKRPDFHHEQLLKRPYIDLNSFAHRRELFDCFGGFDERLTRRQDYDLILKYTWLRDPLHLPCLLTLYQRNDSLRQITQELRNDDSCVSIINQKLADYFCKGLPVIGQRPIRKVTIISWDLCRNHFSKPFALAEALCEQYDVQLISFRFFDEEIFPPLKNVTPRFETLYLPGKPFPDFFDVLDQALEAIRGDIIYVVKPRLPSLGLALLANNRRGIPIILEINDIETVVGSPRRGSEHGEVRLDAVDLDSPELLNPYSELWSRVMHPLAEQIPVVVTHNQGVDDLFDRRCLYMRNLKDERVYDPGLYDRDSIRAELGYTSDDRVIMFGGLLRKHKGIYELVELVEWLNDERYKLLFVGSRITPDQRALVERFGECVRVLPPQDRVAMARINLAADLVILWLDPDVPASHFQMPYKATDAFAMGPTVIANEVSDLGVLAKQGYVRIVPFGDWEMMSQVISEVFETPSLKTSAREACRRLYQRQFSYAAARSNFALMARRALRVPYGPLAVSRAFDASFDAFKRHTNRCGRNVSEPRGSGYRYSSEQADAGADLPAGRTVVLTGSRDIAAQVQTGGGADTLVIIPTANAEKGLAAARLLAQRAGDGVRAVVVIMGPDDTLASVLGNCARYTDARYLAYASHSAFPGVDWLRIGRAALERTGYGLLAFNDGRNPGRMADSGMMRLGWFKSLYGKEMRLPAYRGAEIFAEVSLIAAATNQLAFDADATLVDLEVLEFVSDDASSMTMIDYGLLRQRAEQGFDGILAATALSDEWINSRLMYMKDVPALVDDDEVLQSVSVLDVRDVEQLEWHDAEGVAVVMPCINVDRGLLAARLLVRLAGMPAKVFVVEDTLRQGFIRTLNQTADRLDVKYIVYLAEDAVPGVRWLETAFSELEATGKALLAFNCGKWRGRIAAFGMVRKAWAKTLYDSGIFHSGYRSHRADNEITVIARASDQFVYCPEAMLLENDPAKAFRTSESVASNFTDADRRLFKKRFATAFAGLADPERLEPLWEEYFNQRKLAAASGSERRLLRVPADG